MTIHKPQQQRSLARYHHILDTAARLFTEQGYEHVGTNAIAAAAGVSVGSLYRFFSDKEALVAALVERYIMNLGAVLPPVVEPNQPMGQVVRLMLERVFAFERDHVAFGQILTTTQTGELAHAAVDMHLTLKGWVENTLRVYHPQLTPDAVHLCAAAGMGIVKGMLTMTQPPDLIAWEAVLGEMVETLMAYVENFVGRHAG